MSSRVAICVNPYSGRDVRRLAARATNMTHEAKRDIVARIAAGLDAARVTDIYITREPFRIASMALEHMPLRARVHVLEHPIANDARDTERALAAFIGEGCTTFVSLGGDGTNRAIVRAAPEIDLVPISTGTNNVFPRLVEPTLAGVVAGHLARGNVPRELLRRAKVLHVNLGNGATDVGLIDAVLLANDHVGNMLPFDADKLLRVLLTRAEPDAIGMSPIGGFLDVVEAQDDCGLLVEMAGAREARHRFEAPLSPGFFRKVSVASTTRVALDVPVLFNGPGVLALDGDRDHKIVAGHGVSVVIRRNGPWVPDVALVMRALVARGIIGSLPGEST
ncbi:MAG: hypothetical protein HC809_01670 [Gammaproteobacteria bacterium]|nr:hypothetical protein [Gammaproteobacteria bacterium]